jgi:Excalibur calcium-binding domain
MRDSNFTKARKATWRPSTSTWITAGIWLLLLLFLAIGGGIGGWLVLFAVFVVLTTIYSLIFGRRSWLGLPHRKAGGLGMAAGVVMLVAGAIVTGTTTSPSPVVNVKTMPSSTATASAAAPHVDLLLTDCSPEMGTDEGADGVYVCTPDDAGKLVWMAESDSAALIEGRTEASATAKAEADAVATQKAEAAAAKAAQQKAVAIQKAAAAKKAAIQKAAVAKAVAVRKSAAAKAAADKAAADEAARIAEQQRQQQAPAPLVGGSDPSVYYQNCAAARAAGVAPINAGQPGYRAGLDRDNDGVACE